MSKFVQGVSFSALGSQYESEHFRLKHTSLQQVLIQSFKTCCSRWNPVNTIKYSWIPSMVPFCRAFAEGGRGIAALSTGFILSTPFKRHHWTCTFLFGPSSVNKKQFWTVSFNASGLCRKDIDNSPEKQRWPCRLWIAPATNKTIQCTSVILHWNKWNEISVHYIHIHLLKLPLQVFSASICKKNYKIRQRNKMW